MESLVVYPNFSIRERGRRCATATGGGRKWPIAEKTKLERHFEQRPFGHVKSRESTGWRRAAAGGTERGGAGLHCQHGNARERHSSMSSLLGAHDCSRTRPITTTTASATLLLRRPPRNSDSTSRRWRSTSSSRRLYA